MSSLLDIKMARRQKLMLDAARSLFKEKGHRATMEEIAELSGFGVATVYNYFKNKEGVFSTMIRQEMEIMKTKGENILASDTGEDTVDTIMKLLSVYTEIFDKLSPKMMLEYITKSDKEGDLHASIDWLIGWEKEQLVGLLEKRKALGFLDTSMDSVTAARVINDLLVHRNQHHYIGLPGGPGGLPELKEAVAFVISPYLTH